jgi:Ser/Thr protein kinase RdoA (MazF antagonist)
LLEIMTAVLQRTGHSQAVPEVHWRSRYLCSSFPRRRESRFFFVFSWIPGRASYRQLARNDLGIVSTNLRDMTLAGC